MKSSTETAFHNIAEYNDTARYVGRMSTYMCILGKEKPFSDLDIEKVSNTGEYHYELAIIVSDLNVPIGG